MGEEGRGEGVCDSPSRDDDEGAAGEYGAFIFLPLLVLDAFTLASRSAVRST